MYAKLTYFFLLSCVASLIVSCNSDTPDELVQGSEVSFDVAALSRASLTTSFNEFAVYGDMKLVGENNINNPIIVNFNKTKVEYKINEWSYDGVQYWFPKHEHSFVAIHPLSVLDADTTQYSNSQLSFTYTLPGSNDYTVDIIAATHRRLYDEKDTNTTTTLKFAHIMSQINFSPAFSDNITGGEDYIKIHELELSGFYTKATFNILPASRHSNSQTDDRVVEVTGHRNKGNIVIEFTNPVKILNNGKNVSLCADDDAIIMLPQTFKADEEVKIRLIYSVNDEVKKTQVSATLSGFTWNSGTSYDYKIKIELPPAKMTISNATITPWNLIDDHDEVDAR